jgi:hypothetical protein
MHRPLWSLLAMTALGAGFILQACSGEVTERTSATSGAGGTAPDGGGTGGSTPEQCSISPELPCSGSTFCAWRNTGFCGSDNDSGTCQPRPEICTEDCPGVCGCDGKLYCNACSARAAGVDVSNTEECFSGTGGSGGTVSAVGLATDVPRFMIFKADPARDVCFRLMVEGFDNAGIGIMTPAGWSVGSAEVTDHASDCALTNGYPAPPQGSSAQATKGAGSITIDNPFFPCKVTIHATLSFDAQAPWVPLSEPLDADQLDVSGGCG